MFRHLCRRKRILQSFCSPVPDFPQDKAIEFRREMSNIIERLQQPPPSDYDPEFLQLMRSIPMPLDADQHKGQSGRVGIVGGSAEYTGAPYFAAISALRIGMDLVHVFCASAAAPVIKAYSPDLIVHPVLDSETAVADIQPWLERLHVLVIGPGLGRNAAVLERVAELIALCRGLRKPLVLDADALFLVGQRPELVRDYEGGVILTPNMMEMRRLLDGNNATISETKQSIDKDTETRIGQRLAELYGNEFTVMEKGKIDRIWSKAGANGQVKITNGLPGGSNRRCGGQGDVLSGATASFYVWALQRASELEEKPSVLACRAASFLTRVCNERAFLQLGRGMVASDMIEQVPSVFQNYFEQ